MRIGRFFSLQNGRVGQYLSPRVLVVRTPFRRVPQVETGTYFGFETVAQAQKFVQHLAAAGYRFQLQRSQVLEQFPYEVKLPGTMAFTPSGNREALAPMLAYWDRADQRRLGTANSGKDLVNASRPLARIAA